VNEPSGPSPAEQLPIRLSVQLEYEDYAEAAKAVQATNVERQRRTLSSRQLLCAIGLGLVGAGILVALRILDPLRATRPPLYGHAMLFIPMASIGCGAACVAFAIHRANPRRAARALRWLVVVYIPGMLATAVLLFLTMQAHAPQVWVTSRGAPPTSSAVDWYGILAPHLVWLLLALGFPIMYVSRTRSQMRKMWESQARLRRPVQVEIQPGGVVFDDVVSRRQYEWIAFVRWFQTPSLLVLCPSDVTFETLPKRAFPSPDALAAALALFDSQIIDADKLPFAFPVATSTPGPHPRPGQPSQ
jgi:hypothetical protein